MSGYLLAPRTYTIENTWWQGLYVSSNLAHESAVFGNRRISGGIQACVWIAFSTSFSLITDM
jgi:hypothetical protein